MATQTKTKNSDAQFARTKANKIRKLTKIVEREPNNQTAKDALAYWQAHDRKEKRHRKH